MTCQKCIDRWGQEPSPHGDSSVELIAWYKHRIFHLEEDIDVPWFWKDEIYDEIWVDDEAPVPATPVEEEILSQALASPTVEREYKR